MADAFIQVPPNSTGSKIDHETLTVSAQTVLRQRIQIAGAIDTAIAPVSAAYGLAVEVKKSPMPTIDSGILVNIPTTLTAVPTITTGQAFNLEGINFANTTSGQLTVTVSDGSGSLILCTETIPGYTTFQRIYNRMPITGLKWFASATGINGKAWGY